MIAIISDTHGNFPALEAVLGEIDAIGCEAVYSLGDVAGYYCMVNECIGVLRERGIANIMGNHDHYLVTTDSCPRSNAANRCIEYQRSIVTPGNLEWLGQSVRSLVLGEISMVHGGWNDPVDEYLYEVNEAYFAALPGTHFFSGHTHFQKLADFGTQTYCNPGSVGQPRDGDPRAAYALYDRGAIALKRVAYDIDRIAFEMGQAGFEAYYFENLYAGRRIGAKAGEGAAAAWAQ